MRYYITSFKTQYTHSLAIRPSNGMKQKCFNVFIVAGNLRKNPLSKPACVLHNLLNVRFRRCNKFCYTSRSSLSYTLLNFALVNYNYLNRHPTLYKGVEAKSKKM
jgi:hypothetical protein